MTGLAKALGVICIGVALLVSLNAVYAYAATDRTTTSEFGDSLVFLLVGGQLVVALMLATIGAAAYVVGSRS